MYSRLPPIGNRELLTVTDAYHVVWDAAAMAMDASDPNYDVQEMKAVQSEEIGFMFDTLDQYRTSGVETITLGNLVEQLSEQINQIREERAVASGSSHELLGDVDSRTLALMGLDIYVRWAKDELSEQI